MANKRKKWEDMTGEEKTREQATELFMLEQGKMKKKAERNEQKKKKWEEMSGEEKTKAQEMELFMLEQQPLRKKDDSFFIKLERVCDDIWNKMSGFEKTKHQAAELMMLEQGKSLNKEGKGDRGKGEMSFEEKQNELTRLRGTAFTKEQEAKKRAAEQEMHIENVIQKDYEIEKEFTPVELVRAVSVLHHDDNGKQIAEKKKVKLYVRKGETLAEKAVRRGWRSSDAAADKAEQDESDLEISKLQGAISDALAKGYDIDIKEKYS